jgi:ABC-type multidrug transport system permease subunit
LSTPSAPTAVRWGWWLQVIVTGWREYLSDNPAWITAVTFLPRAVLQTIFFVLLCGFVGGGQLRAYAFAGAVALTLTLGTVVSIAEVPANDKWSGTFWRIRLGVLSPFTVFVLRSLPYPLVGFATAVTTYVLVAPVFGFALVGPVVLPELVCLALLALTTAAVGLAGAAFAIGRRANVLVGNLIAYLMIVSSGALTPPGRIPWMDPVGAVLPMRHGLAAMRAWQAHKPFAADLAAEALVGAGWLAVAAVGVRIQAYRARSSGHDSFS